MAAGYLDLVLEQGARYYHQFKWQYKDGSAYDLTGFTAEMDIKDIISLSPYISITLPNIITVDIPKSVTTTLTFGKASYNIELVPGDPEHTVRFLKGFVTVSKDT